MQFTNGDFAYLGRCLEGFFFGLYSGIFALHLQYHASKEGSDNAKRNILFHALCVLYVFSMAVIALDIATFVAADLENGTSNMAYHLAVAQIPVFGCCDFIAQSILIHRCWIVWGRNIRVVIIPSILAFAYLVMWMAAIGAVFIGQGEIDETEWGDILVLTSLTASMTVNALVTGLIVFKIFSVFKSVTTSEEKSLGVTGGKQFRSLIFVIIESGMALFAIQLARLIFTLPATAENAGYELIVCIHEMLNGITPTIILVRVSMGLSFHDKPSLVEAVSSLRFASDDPNSALGTGSTSQDESLRTEPDGPNAIPEMIKIGQERKDSDIGGSDDIQIVSDGGVIELKDNRLP